MLEHYEKVKEFFGDVEYKVWKKLSAGEQANLFQKSINIIISDPVTGSISIGRKIDYLSLSLRIYKLFSLVMPHKEANDIRDEVEFFEGIRRGIIKSTIVDPIYIDKKTESAVKDLISKNNAAEGVIDILHNTGKKNQTFQFSMRSF